MPKRLLAWAERLMASRPADFVIGGRSNAYLERWWVITRNPVFNVYLHRFWRSDDDRALHDHPWLNLSLVLAGGYYEQTIAAGGVSTLKWRPPGSAVLRAPWAAHRLELPDELRGRTVTLFVTGPKLREWGFHCRIAGWVLWRDFVASDDPGAIGAGCGEGGE